MTNPMLLSLKFIRKNSWMSRLKRDWFIRIALSLLVMVHPLSPHTENVKNVSANVKKTASTTVAVIVTFLSLTAISAGIPRATAFIMGMIYICWSIRKAIFRYFPTIPMLPNMIRTDFFKLFSEWEHSFRITKYQKFFWILRTMPCLTINTSNGKTSLHLLIWMEKAADRLYIRTTLLLIKMAFLFAHLDTECGAMASKLQKAGWNSNARRSAIQAAVFPVPVTSHVQRPNMGVLFIWS